MTYAKFIDECIQAMKNGTFKQRHAQQSKVFSDNEVELNKDLGLKLRTVLLQQMKSDVLKYHICVSVLAEGNSQMRNVLTDSLFEILSSILGVLKNYNNDSHGQLFSFTIKALYAILQYISPCCSPATDMESKFRDIMAELKLYILSDNIAMDTGLVSSSSFVLLISYLESCPRSYFNNLIKSFPYSGRDASCPEYKNANFLRSENDKNDGEIGSYITDESEYSSGSSYSSLNLIHGVLNVKPKWLFEIDDKMLDKKSCYKITKSLLFRLWPFIQSHCTTVSVYSYQCIQVLRKWIEVLSKLISETFQNCVGDNSLTVKNHRDPVDVNEEEKFLHCTSLDNIPNTNDETVRPDLNVVENTLNMNSSDKFSSSDCFLCADSSLQTLLSIETGQIVELLNINFEKRGKGISNLILECFKELLDIHDRVRPGHATFSVQRILKSIVSDSLHSKGAYLHIQMAVEFLGPRRIFKNYPSLPDALALGLKTSQFAAVSTDVYCVILLKLLLEDWLDYFESIHRKIIQTSDSVMWTNYKNLWLPPTLSRHPELVTRLLTPSDKSTRELEVNIIILRIFRSKSDANIFSKWHDHGPRYDNFSSLCTEKSEKSPSQSDSQKWKSDPNFETSFPERSFYEKCLAHGDENIRSELFTLLCRTRKQSLPLCPYEVNLLKLFFRQNMSVDSQSFRQSLKKPFQVLLCRIKDSAGKQLKKFKNELNEADANDIVASPVGLGIEFLIWLINTFNNNLDPSGNYPRLSTTLNLYFILFTTFYDSQNSSLDNGNKCKNFGILIHLASEVQGRNHKVVYSNFTCRRTFHRLLECCTNEMDDLRELAANVLTLVAKNNDLIKKDLDSLDNWFAHALLLIESPKSSDVESGANLIKVLVELRPERPFILSNDHERPQDVNFVDSVSKTDHERFIISLLRKIENEFGNAKTNVLQSACTRPISGTIQTLTYCLVECPTISNNLNIEFLVKVLSSLAKLYNELACFVLDSLSASSSAGPNIPPSFADMGKSIDALVTRYSSKPICDSTGEDDAPLSAEGVNGIASSENIEGLSRKNQCEDSSYDHQIILSFFWHLLKMCCWSSSKLTQKYSIRMSHEIFKKFFVETVVQVLVGTRHKGAMESAQESLAIMTQCAFDESQNCGKHSEKRIEMVEQQLNGILESLESSLNQPKISTTRKAAGYAMLFTAICSNIPRRFQKINDNVISRLLNIVQTKIESCDDSGSVDLPSTSSLHILHSMVLSAKMIRTVSPHLSSISIVCLQSFASDVWSVRNAALQLFGAVVPKLLGQKKVKDDTASCNSITAAEFCNRNPSLISPILNILNWCSSSEQEDYIPLSDDEEGVNIDNIRERSSLSSCRRTKEEAKIIHLGIDRESVKLKASSFLVPLLGLLARLNPGNEIQQNKDIRSILNTCIRYILPILGNPVFVIRRLAAASLVTLSNKQTKEEILNELCTKASGVHEAGIHSETKRFISTALNWATCQERSNYIHGMLMFVENIIDLDPKYFKEYGRIQVGIITWLKRLLLSSKCDVNVSLALNILFKLDYIDDVRTSLLSFLNSSLQPGTSVLLRNIIKLRLKYNLCDISKVVISDSQDEWEEVYLFIKESLDGPIIEINKPLFQRTLWDYLRSQTFPLDYSKYVKVCKILELLSIVLERDSLDMKMSEENLDLLHTIFNCDYNLNRYACIVFSYFVRDITSLNIKLDTLVSNMNKWALIVQDLSNPKMSEDCRLCASKSLQVCFETVLNGAYSTKITFPLIIASVNLLEDEDYTIRMRSSLIIKNKIFRTPTAINPSVALTTLINRFVILSLKNFDYINLLWDLSLMKNQESIKRVEKLSCNFFESNTNNTYSEPCNISEIIYSEMEKRKVENLSNTKSDSVPKVKVNDFIASKLLFLSNLNSSLSNEEHSDNPRLFNCVNSSKKAIIRYGIKFLQHLTILFDIGIVYDLQKLSQEFTGM